MLRPPIGAADPRIDEVPTSVLQIARSRIDSPRIAIKPFIVEDDDVFEMNTLIRDAQRMHDRLTITVALPQPQARRRDGKLRRLTVNIARFEPRILLQERSRHGAERRHCEKSE